MYDALQRNEHLEVLRSLQLPLERHCTQRHVSNCVAWPNQSCQNRPAIVYQARYTLDRTFLHTARDCFQPTHARARLLFCSIPNCRFSWQVLSRHPTCGSSSLNSRFLRHSTPSFPSIELHSLITFFVTLFVTSFVLPSSLPSSLPS
jgi:hypothetical protein